MEKIENFKEKANDLIYPVFYDKGILFKENSVEDFFYLFKENLVRNIYLEEINGDVFYPSTNEELAEIESVINFIFMRLSNSQLLKSDDKQLLRIIKKIKMNSITNMSSLNNINQTAQVLTSSNVFDEVNSLI